MDSYGYNPLSVGDWLNGDKFEVIRNLDGQDVWLARVLKSFSFHAVCEYVF